MASVSRQPVIFPEKTAGCSPMHPVKLPCYDSNVE